MFGSRQTELGVLLFVSLLFSWGCFFFVVVVGVFFGGRGCYFCFVC